jgi:hypothetical protein
MTDEEAMTQIAMLEGRLLLAERDLAEAQTRLVEVERERDEARARSYGSHARAEDAEADAKATREALLSVRVALHEALKGKP